MLRHSAKNEENEGGFEEFHSNNPRCCRCKSIIIGEVFYAMDYKACPYCKECYNIVIDQISKDGP